LGIGDWAQSPIPNPPSPIPNPPSISPFLSKIKFQKNINKKENKNKTKLKKRMKRNRDKSSKQERVQVSVRIRPFSEAEKELDPSTPIKSINQKNNSLSIQKDYDTKTFSYDHIYPEDSNQSQIFEETSKNVVKSVLSGYNGTIFAYGQTGTGKTYTMVGEFSDEKNKGIIPRAFDYIFENVKQDKEHKYNIMISFIQIYLEHIQDLIEPTLKEIRIRESPEEGVYLEGVKWVKVNSTQECAEQFHKGEKNRVTESTIMNKDSSRSHAILIAKIERSIVLSKEQISELAKESNEKIKAERVMTTSFLYLVDLAGSERVKKTKAVDMRLEEAKKINYSLLTLGKCINALAEGNTTFISYRESVLTRLLQESLGGNAKTSLIVTVSPSNYNADETVSSFNFAQRAMKVKNKPVLNISVDYHALYIKLQEDFDKLNDKYANLEIKYEKLHEENQKLKNGEALVELQKNNINQNLGGSYSSMGNSSNKNTINNLNKEKQKLQNDINKLEESYKDTIKNKVEEYESVLKDIDKIIFEKEQTIEKLVEDNKKLNDKNKTNQEIINDYKKEKEELMNSISDLTNKLNYEQESRGKKSDEEHKKELDSLNAQLEFFEKKIISLENNNLLNTNSINLVKNKIDNKINFLSEEKDNLLKEKSNNVIKISQNDIKIKLLNDEKNNIDKRLPSITEEMKTIFVNRKNEIINDVELRQLENGKINEMQNDIVIRVNNIDEEIKKMKQLKKNMGLIGDEEISKVDKTEIFCLNKFNETNSFLMNRRYEENNQRIKKYLDSINDLTKKINDLTKVIKAIKKENIELNKKVNQNLKSSKNYINNNDINSSINNEKNKERDDKKIKEYENQINELKKDNNTLSKNLLTERKTNNEKRSKLIEDFNKKLEESKNKINQLIQENTELNKNLNFLNNDLAENKEHITHMKNTNEREIAEKISSYETQIELLNKEIKSKEKMINDSITINEAIKSKNKNKDEEIKKLNLEKNELNNKINELNKEIKEIKNTGIKNNESELQTLNETLNELNITNEQLTTQLDEINNKYKTKTEEFDTLNNKYKKTFNELNTLKDSNGKLNIKLNTVNNELKLLYKKNEILTNDLSEKEKLFGENLGKSELNAKLLEDYKTQLNNMKKENMELNKNNILINENNQKLKTNIKLITEDNDQLKNQIQQELIPKINNYESQINYLSKENKAKEKIINSNNINNTKINLSFNKNIEEIKNLKNEKEQNTKEINDLTKEINKLKTKLIDKDKEIAKLKLEMKNINDDTINKKDEYSNEINILNNKLTTQQNTNEEHIKKIQELNNKIKTMQNDTNKLTQKNTEYINKIVLYKEQINNLTEMNEELKIKNKSEISELNNKIKRQTLTANSETNAQLNLLSINCDEVADIFNKFQKEIQTIQTFINSNKYNNTNIDLSNLNKLIEEENEEIERQSTFSTKNDNNKKSIEGNGSNKPSNVCMNNISEKVGDSRNKFLLLINSYYNSLTHINKKIKEKENLHNSINDLNNNLFKEILPNIENFEQIANLYQKKIEKCKTDEEVLLYLNRLINDIINKLKGTTNEQKEEIERLHNRVEFFSDQYSNMKKTQEIIANEERNTHEKVLKKKEDEIQKMKLRLTEKEKNIDENKNKYNDLSDQLLDLKEKYKMKENDFETIIKTANEQKDKNDIKDVNYGKHNFSIFYDKVREFAEGLYNYTGIK